jgi:hypothetical protein
MNVRRSAAVAGLVVSIAVALAWYRLAPGQAPAGQPALITIDAAALEGLKAEFNRHANETRLVVLLSPTWGTCLRGASAVESLLQKHSNHATRVFAVWQPILPTDWAAPASSVLGRLSDRRVQQYWDPNHLLAAQMKKDARAPQPVQDCCIRSGILWDLAAVYPPGSIWSDRMPAAAVFNGPVVDVADAIEDALTPGRARSRTDSTAAPSGGASTTGLVFLTRGGCASTTVMRRHLDEALNALGLAAAFEVIDQDRLAETDPRRGYPTPTLLYADRDIFGMEPPAAPPAGPTWRLYPGGVPSATAIRERLSTAM